MNKNKKHALLKTGARSPPKAGGTPDSHRNQGSTTRTSRTTIWQFRRTSRRL
jgi:hypothetical protein